MSREKDSTVLQIKPTNLKGKSLTILHILLWALPTVELILFQVETPAGVCPQNFLAWDDIYYII